VGVSAVVAAALMRVREVKRELKRARARRRRTARRRRVWTQRSLRPGSTRSGLQWLAACRNTALHSGGLPRGSQV